MIQIGIFKHGKALDLLLGAGTFVDGEIVGQLCQGRVQVSREDLARLHRLLLGT